MPITSKVFCGLDCSLTGTGFCKIVGSELTSITIKTKPADFPTDIDRVIYIAQTIGERIPDDVGLICIEDYFVPLSAQQMGSAIQLVQLGTAVRIALHARRLPFVTIAASQLKKVATGKGTGDKSIIVKEVYKRWGVDCPDNNQADSVVLAKTAELTAAWLDGDRSMPDFQKDIIGKILKERPKYNFKGE